MALLLAPNVGFQPVSRSNILLLGMLMILPLVACTKGKLLDRAVLLGAIAISLDILTDIMSWSCPHNEVLPEVTALQLCRSPSGSFGKLRLNVVKNWAWVCSSA